MEIIPVIDIMGGKVVQANGGDRAQYPLLRSILTNSDEPRQVINDLLAYHPFPSFYIADLDAIEYGVMNELLYSDISKQFPKTKFWLDAGIRTKKQWQELVNIPNVYPVLGSETVESATWLDENDAQKKSILSLDFKHGLFLGDEALLSQPKRWTERVIAMNLDCIASKSGPDFELLTDLKNRSNSQIIAAGGIRSEQDLMLLEQQGIEQVLVASALHDGRITIDTKKPRP